MELIPGIDNQKNRSPLMGREIYASLSKIRDGLTNHWAIRLKVMVSSYFPAPPIPLPSSWNQTATGLVDPSCLR